ncbi:hypothetical protein XENTR_v10016375 [Xenopus tropicalis]|nr:hypothetical protein XENTR_v10016375 [Xenopus tropicalis]
MYIISMIYGKLYGTVLVIFKISFPCVINDDDLSFDKTRFPVNVQKHIFLKCKLELYRCLKKLPKNSKLNLYNQCSLMALSNTLQSPVTWVKWKLA